MKNINIDAQALELAKNAQIQDDVGFGKILSPIMIECDYENGEWGEIKLKPYGQLA